MKIDEWQFTYNSQFIKSQNGLMKLQLSHDKRYIFLPIYKGEDWKKGEDGPYQKMELLIWNTHGKIEIQKMMMNNIFD